MHGIYIKCADFLRRNIWMIILILGAFIVRYYNLGRKSFWFDESLVLLEAEKAVPVILGVRAEGIHPPLYRLLLHFWMEIGRGETFLRLLSVVFSIAAIPFCFAIARRVFKSRAAAYLAAAITAFSPFQVYFAREIRMYPLLLLSALASLYFFLSMHENDSLTRRIFYVISTVAALYTHYFAFWVLAAENAVFLVCYVIFRGRDKESKPDAGKWWFSQAAVLLLFLAWAENLFVHLERMKDSFWAGKTSLSTLPESLGNLFYGYYNAGLFPAAAGAFLFLLFIAGTWRLVCGFKENGCSSRGRAHLLCLAAFFIPVVGSLIVSGFFVPMYMERPLIFAACFYYILVVAGLEYLTKYRLFFYGICAALAVYLFICLANIYSAARFNPAAGMVEKKPVREVVGYILSKRAGNEPVLLAHCSMLYPFLYYTPAATRGFIYLVENASVDPGDVSTLFGIKQTFGINITVPADIPVDSGGIWLVCSGWGPQIVPVSKSMAKWMADWKMVFKDSGFPGFEIYYLRSNTKMENKNGK